MLRLGAAGKPAPAGRADPRTPAERTAREAWVVPLVERPRRPDRCPPLAAAATGRTPSSSTAGVDARAGRRRRRTAVEMAGRLIWPPRRWTPARSLRREHQRQAANQVSIGNCVTSLRLLSALDWSDVLREAPACVEAVLREDPAGVYAGQDFATRDRYRQAVEKLSRGSRVRRGGGGRAVAVWPRRAARRGRSRRATTSATTSSATAARRWRPRCAIGPSLRDRLLDAVLSPPAARLLRRRSRPSLARPGRGCSPSSARGRATRRGCSALVAAGRCCCRPATSRSAWSITGRAGCCRRASCPSCDFKDGIPADCATFVVMPTHADAARQRGAPCWSVWRSIISANPDPQLRFALLTDFADAPAEHMPEDDELPARGPGRRTRPQRALRRRRARTASSSSTAAASGTRPGLLDGLGAQARQAVGVQPPAPRRPRHQLHRPSAATSSQLPHIRYVITLDADTQLPRDAARRLIATLAHPLNRPRFDPARAASSPATASSAARQPDADRRPQVAVRPHLRRLGRHRPLHHRRLRRLQDLFGDGTFTGKGIYDVDAFEAGRRPAPSPTTTSSATT